MAAGDERRLHHLTVASGHLATTGRDAVDGRIVDQLLPVIDAEGGAVPGMPHLWLDLWRPIGPGRRPVPGAAFFQIDQDGTGATRPSKRPVLMAFAAWMPAMSADAWSQVRQADAVHRRWLPSAPPLPATPPPLPWLTVFVTPAMTTLLPEEQMALGDLGRCLAWALIESE